MAPRNDPNPPNSALQSAFQPSDSIPSSSGVSSRSSTTTRARGRPRTTNLTLGIPSIPQAPSNWRNYTRSSHLPHPSLQNRSISMPSPITPSTSSQAPPEIPRNLPDYQRTLEPPHTPTMMPLNIHTTLSTLQPNPHMPPTPVTPSTSLPAAEHAVYDLPRPDVTVRWADHVDATFEHSQSRLRAAKLSEGEKMDKALEYILDDLGYDSLGEFSTKLFGTIVSERQRRVIRAFLQGRSSVKPIDLCKAIYDNRYSYPSYRSAHIEERQTALTATDPTTLRYARCQILCWSRILVGSRVHDEIGNLTLPSEPDAMVPSRLAASAGEHNRVAGMITVTREAILSFSIQDRISLFKREAPVSWYLTQCMAAPQKNGVVITVRKQRPPPIVQFGAISSFIICRNRFANGYFQMHAGIWHFACRSHTDIKRLHCRMGLTVHGTTSRTALVEMSETGMQRLRVFVECAHKAHRVRHRVMLDNVQDYAPAHEGGIGRESRMICGTAATAIILEDCDDKAFDLDDRIARILKNERANLTTNTLYEEINWTHIHKVQSLHVLRALVNYVPALDNLSKTISERFRSKDHVAVHRMREGRKTVVQPLGTNSEKEIETEGMRRCIDDFNTQCGSKPEYASSLISWFSGDGGSVLAIDRAQKYSLLMYDPDDPHADYHSLYNLLATPGLWHMEATIQNTLAENHWSSGATDDPSALYSSASATTLKQPTNFKDNGNYYHLQRCMLLFWNCQVIDCWKHKLGLPNFADIIPHFERLSRRKQVPSFDALLKQAEELVDQYMSQDAYEQVLSLKTNNDTPENWRFTTGEPYEPSPTCRMDAALDDMAPSNAAEVEEPFGETVEAEEVSTEKQKKKTPKDGFKEAPGFDGDRVLANSILFKMEYSWWIEVRYAVTDGDIGRAWEIIKIWMYVFAGGSNNNYRDIVLEMWCLFKYESSKELKDAIWNNMLINLTGEVGKWIPDDLLQEHYNRWLEDLVEKSGGSFDDPFMRRTISPNVDFFLRLKEEFETAADLYQRSKSHTSPHLRDEYKVLLTKYGEEKLHVFRPKRSMGHAAVNLFDRGYERLDNGVLRDLLEKHTSRVNVLRDMEQQRQASRLIRESSSNSMTNVPIQIDGQPPIPEPRVIIDHNTSLPVVNELLRVGTPSSLSSTPPREPPPSSSPASTHDIPPNSSSPPSENGSVIDPESVVAPEGVQELLSFLEDDTDLYGEQDYSRLKPGPELVPSLDENGNLVNDWEDDEEMEEELRMGVNDEDEEHEFTTYRLSDDENYWAGSDSDTSHKE